MRLSAITLAPIGHKACSWLLSKRIQPSDAAISDGLTVRGCKLSNERLSKRMSGRLAHINAQLYSDM